MDLKHDWKALNEVLFHGQASDAASTLVLLEDKDAVVDGVVSNGKAFDDVGVEGISSNKGKLDELAGKYGVDQTMVLSKNTLDHLVIEAAGLGTNYFQQLQSLRTKLKDQVGKQKDAPIISRRHFVLDLFGKKLMRMLPRRFNVLIFVDERPNPIFGATIQAGTPGDSKLAYRAILLSYSDGKLDQFYEPDFSSLHENRLVNWPNEAEAIGQYLESRYILPCYALFMHEEDWEKCLKTAARGRPWQQFVRCFDERRAAIYPLKMGTKTLLAAERVRSYFSRPA
jgi:hypothetical protein